MTPNPEYTIRTVTVYRLVDPEGNYHEFEDDHGSYPVDFDTYEEAFGCLVQKMQLPFHGPLTEADQKRAEQNAKFWSSVQAHYARSMEEMLNRPSFLPENTGKTIRFVQ